MFRRPFPASQRRRKNKGDHSGLSCSVARNSKILYTNTRIRVPSVRQAILAGPWLLDAHVHRLEGAAISVILVGFRAV